MVVLLVSTYNICILDFEFVSVATDVSLNGGSNPNNSGGTGIGLEVNSNGGEILLDGFNNTGADTGVYLPMDGWCHS